MARLSSRPAVVDLFAGAGLFSLAFKQEGFRLACAVEMNRDAAATYAANFGSRNLLVSDVRDIVPHGDCDVLIAGPPCQGFSTLGKKDASDPRNKLSLEVARWAAVLRPSVIVIENVASFLKSRSHRSLRRRLNRLGYSVSTHMMDARDFGIPQHRVRSATVATLSGRAAVPPPLQRRVRTVRDAWADLPRKRKGKHDPLDVHLPTTPLALARMKAIPPGGDKRDILRRAPHLAAPSWFRCRTAVTDVWGRMVWDKPSNTLRTEFVNPSKGRYIHPEEHRVISLREAARLQSIPDSYSWSSNVPYVAAKQIGNSVPPRLGRALARAVAGHLSFVA